MNHAAMHHVAHIQANRISVPKNEDSNVLRVFIAGDDSCNQLSAALSAFGCEVLEFGGDISPTFGSDRDRCAIVIDTERLSNGLSHCRRIRESGKTLPLVILATNPDPFDEVLGLELGADEIIAKPVHPRVLVARLNALTRRAAVRDRPASRTTLSFGRLNIDGINREVQYDNVPVEVTASEFDLLWLLARHAGQVLARDEALRELRGLQDTAGNRSIDARLYRLRRRFAGISCAAQRIKTVRPNGYMFSNLPW